ncbi:BMC domain-containing protein [Oscillospiraceae bacterium PP1C4]
MMKALGMIEVYGYLPAVEALDSALKAANVNLVSVTKVRGGLVTVLVTGDVGAVKAAMDASASAAGRVGQVVSVHVIPRPSLDLEKMLSTGTSPSPEDPPPEPSDAGKPQTDAQEQDVYLDSEPDVEPDSEPSIEPDVEPSIETDIEPSIEPSIEPNVGKPLVDLHHYTREQLEGMKVVEMRDLARALGLTSMTKKEIKFAKREELIDKICEFQNRRDD